MATRNADSNPVHMLLTGRVSRDFSPHYEWETIYKAHDNMIKHSLVLDFDNDSQAQRVSRVYLADKKIESLF